MIFIRDYPSPARWLKSEPELGTSTFEDGTFLLEIMMFSYSSE
jgi:hypothetical protein